MSQDQLETAPEEATKALRECERLIADWTHWATRNRRLSLLAGLTVVWASSMIPVSIVISTETGAFVFGKLIPSLLGALAAVAAGAVQVFRPHDRWRILERQQYLMEGERLRYLNRLGDYASGDPDQLLLERAIAAQDVVTDQYQAHVVAGAAKALEIHHDDR